MLYHVCSLQPRTTPEKILIPQEIRIHSNTNIVHNTFLGNAESQKEHRKPGKLKYIKPL